MKEIYKALANFQQEVPVIHEATKGYGYTYSDLKTILKVINPLLKKHGLTFCQTFDDDTLITALIHPESEQTIQSSISLIKDVNLKGMNAFQVLGSQITYLRRYSLSSMLGLVTDVDADASGEQLPPKKSLTDDQFAKALKAIKEKKITVDKVKTYALTEAQLTQLNEFIKL